MGVVNNTAAHAQKWQRKTCWSQHWNLNFNAAKCALLRLSSGCPPTAFNYILNGDLISAQEAHRDHLCLVISHGESTWEIFYPEHTKLSQLWSLSSNQEDSLFAPSSFTAYILFTDLASPLLERHNNSWKDPESCDQIHLKNNFTSDYRSHLIALKILSLTMQLELYDIMFFIRSMKGPTNAFNIDDHVTFHTASTHSSTHLKLKHVLSKTNSARHFTYEEFLDWGTLYLPLT